MVWNYLKIAWRNLWRNKFFSAINIGGLALGISFSLLIMLWVQNELSVDAFHQNGQQLYQVYEREYYNNNITGDYDTPGPLAVELKKNIPEIKYATTLQEENNLNTFRAGSKIIKMEGTAAGEDLFKMFSYRLLAGNAATALSSITGMAISHKMAIAFFGSPERAMGKTLRFENTRDFMISAVFDDLPANVSRRFDYLISWEGFKADHAFAGTWSNSGPRTFVMMRPNVNVARINKQLSHFLDAYNKGSNAYHIEYGLQRFGDVYLHSHFTNGETDGGRIVYVQLFSIVAIFILLIACINFMNLTTARSLKRAREIGVRKVAGAMRSTLILQFIGEALLLTVIAVTLSLILLTQLLPLFNSITQKQITLPFGHTAFWLQLLLITLVTGIVSGSYPAFLLSSFSPVKALKSNMRMPGSSEWFRKGLVVFQFVLSIVLIVGTIVITRQVNYIQHKYLGYDRDHLVYIPLEGELVNRYQFFKDEALKLPGVQVITQISDTPTNLNQNTNDVDWEGRDAINRVSFELSIVGYDFMRTMKLNLLVGRDFSKDYPTDSTSFIVNEAAAKAMGYQKPLGKPVSVWANNRKGTIVGVVKDFHFRSLQEEIKPLIFILGKNRSGNVLVRLQPGKTQQALTGLQNLCKKINPEFSFSYQFSDLEYQRLYNSDLIVGRLSNIIACLAVLISCLGLLGLTIYTAEQRTKEIGIRKILGASVISVFLLLSGEFLLLVMVALLVASPLAWFGMTQWLQNYAYHIKIQWWMFGLSALISLLLTLFTVSYQSIRAALSNPVKSLKTE